MSNIGKARDDDVAAVLQREDNVKNAKQLKGEEILVGIVHSCKSGEVSLF